MARRVPLAAEGPGEKPSSPPVSAEQHPLAQSIALHLLPGAALTVFILLAAPVVRDWGFPGVFALFLGIPLVIVPLELGYLLYRARAASGGWSLASVVSYREKLPRRRYAVLGLALAAWWIVLLVLFIALIDEWIADTFFAWMPATIREFASFEDEEDLSGGRTALLLGVAFLFNGFVGPVVEELYFRGHLLPRIDRFGRAAPLLNTVLFSVYHFWTPWANIGRIIALLPWVYTVWRTRSLMLSLIVHMSVNLTFLLLILAVFLE